jgi:hypothetical protein
MKRLFQHNPVAYLEQALTAAGRPLTDLGEREVLDYLSIVVPGYKEMYTSKDPEASSNARILSTGLFQTYHFNRQKRVFRLEEGLTQKLLHTGIEHVDSSFIRSPFKSIYVSLPYNQELVIPDGTANEYLVDGFYLYVDTDVATEHVSLDMDGKTPVSGEVGGSPKCTALKFLATGLKRKDASATVNEEDDALFFGTFLLAPGDVMPQVKHKVDKWTSVETNKPYLETLFRFILNTILYITSPTADLSPILAKFEPVANKDAERKNKGLSKINQTSVGKSIRVLRGMAEHYGETSVHMRLRNCPRWLVRGHWRNQAHGEGRSLRKMLWVEPFEKGKGLAEVLSEKDYLVGA